MSFLSNWNLPEKNRKILSWSFFTRQSGIIVLTGFLVMGIVGLNRWMTFEHQTETPTANLIQETYVALPWDNQNDFFDINLPGVNSDLSQVAINCEAGKCVQNTDPIFFSQLKNYFNLKKYFYRESALPALAKDSTNNGILVVKKNGAEHEQGFPEITGDNKPENTAFTARTGTTFRYAFTTQGSDNYFVNISSQNFGSGDLITAPICADENNAQSTPNCVPTFYRSHVFSGIRLYSASATDPNPVNYANISVPATNTPQSTIISLGSLQNNTKYILEFTWANDFRSSAPKFEYDVNLQINSLTFSRIAPINAEQQGGNTGSKITENQDIIGIRAYSNPEYSSLIEWYKKYAPNPGNPIVTTINGYPALVDGNTTYIMGFNLINRSDLPCWGLQSGQCSSSSSAVPINQISS